ncbi:glycosyltransferase family 88 protein [Legionella lytica]|uniref:Glycosyltransferase family 88 protein n=1 Tax=Legionella lytica TaxID=96232 RepID=A0ABW8DA70_9GAMM
MFNREFNSKDPQYLFDITRYYKIWFSTNPDSYLGVEDQLRFIEMRQNNPNAILSFIYSSTCLSPTAIQELNLFCKQHNITSIEFERLKSEMQQPQDQKLYAYAEAEIQHALEGAGGNMAAASDCTRLLTPVIEKYGIYSDFDVRVSLTQVSADADYLSLRGPVLFTAEYMPVQQSVLLLVNTDCLAFSLNDKIPTQLSAAALGALEKVKTHIIERYTQDFSWDTFSPDIKINQVVNSVDMQAIMDNFHHLHPENPNVFHFRKYLTSLAEVKSNSSSALTPKAYLMKLSVINMSGPALFNYLYENVAPEGARIPPLIPIEKKWLPFLALYERSDIGFYQPIAKLIESNNSYSSAMKSMSKQEKIERKADHSWLPEGMADKKVREEKIQGATSVLQRACRRYLIWKQEHPLLNEVLKVCHDESILNPLRENNFELALRRASFGLKHQVVELLVTHKLNRQIELNINGQSETNPKTALDWAMSAKPKTQTEKETQSTIIKTLKEADALTGAELQAATRQESTLK